MPQIDRYKNRIVPIEFISFENFSKIPYQERYTLVFITRGTLRGELGNRPVILEAPAVLCLTPEDKLKVEAAPSAAQSFCFRPDFMDTIVLTPTTYIIPDLKIETGFSLFEGSEYLRTPRVPAAAYQQLFEWFFVIGTEVYAQSSSNWVCRIKKYLIQILGMLEDINQQEEMSPVDEVLEYIYMNYHEKITLSDLTSCAHLNRVSLNELFSERCGMTAMGYLKDYRMKIARNMLTHTGMSLQEIAHATGYGYDTYFIKQFKKQFGMTPSEYRESSRTLAEMA